MTMAEIDAALVKGLKGAKSKKMCFGLVYKGTEGKLIIGKKKPTKEMAAAKKEIGGTLITGKIFGPLDDLIFEVVKEPAGSAAAAVKKIAKVHAGLTIVPTFKLAGDADEEEEDDGEDEGDGGNASEESDRRDPKDVGAAVGKGEPKALNLAPWTAARQHAITELKALAGKIAATKHATAVGVLKEINVIIQKLPATPTPEDVDKLEEFVRHDDILTAAEEVPGDFHHLKIRAPLIKALELLRK